MALAQERADLVLGLGHVLAGADLDGDRADGAGIGLTHAQHLFLRRRERDQDDVVLILTPGVLALAREKAHHRERDLLDPDDLADRVGLAEEVEGRRLAEESHLRRAVDVLLEDRAALDDGPLTRLEVRGRDPLDLGGPVQIAVDDLRRATNRWRGCLHDRDLAGDRHGIVFRDRELAPRAEPDAGAVGAAREDNDQVRPEALDLLGHAGLGARPDPHHRNHGADPDDDAQHRERAPELVDAERPAGDPNALPDGHAASSSSRGRDVSAAAASTGAATRSSGPTAVSRACARTRRSRAGSAAYRRGSSTFSSALVRGNRLNCWKTNPIFVFRILARSSAERPATSWPSSTYRPALGVSRQPSRFMKVDFPEPDGPMTATNSPRPIVTDTPRSACTVCGPR